MRGRGPLTAVLVGAGLAGLPAAGALGLLALTTPALTLARAPGASAADLLVAVCGGLGVLLLAALALDVLRAGVQEAAALARAPRVPGPTARTQSPPPRLVRRLVALAVGLALGSGTLAAQAAPRTPDAGWAALAPVTPGWASVDDAPGGLPDAAWASVPSAVVAVPDPVRSAPAAEVSLPGGTRAPAVEVPAEVVVKRGDSLWSLAEDQLGPDADETALTRAVEHLHRVNLDVIGADPDLLLPGQVLRLS